MKPFDGRNRFCGRNLSQRTPFLSKPEFDDSLSFPTKKKRKMKLGTNMYFLKIKGIGHLISKKIGD
jgi:hypothetical protein